jgi:hypothetical protein
VSEWEVVDSIEDETEAANVIRPLTLLFFF